MRKMTGYKFRLLDRNNVLFEETMLKVADPEAIILGERVYLPVRKQPGVYREACCAVAPMSYFVSLQGH
jgi:hypothetical protein